MFIPDLTAKKPSSIPYFEDSSKLAVPGRGTTKTHEQLQKEVVKLLAELGAYSVTFTPGNLDEAPIRYGFRIDFRFEGAMGRIDIAALPIRHTHPTKKYAALAQALYLFRDKIQAQVYASIYEPGSIPLVPYLINPQSGKTVTEGLIEFGMLPMLKASIE